MANRLLTASEFVRRVARITAKAERTYGLKRGALARAIVKALNGRN